MNKMKEKLLDFFVCISNFQFTFVIVSLICIQLIQYNMQLCVRCSVTIKMLIKSIVLLCIVCFAGNFFFLSISRSCFFIAWMRAYKLQMASMFGILHLLFSSQFSALPPYVHFTARPLVQSTMDKTTAYFLFTGWVRGREREKEKRGIHIDYWLLIQSKYQTITTYLNTLSVSWIYVNCVCHFFSPQLRVNFVHCIDIVIEHRERNLCEVVTH